LLLGPNRTIINLGHLGSSLHVHAERLIIPETRRSDGRTDLDAINWLYTKATQACPGNEQAKNLYVSRANAKSRRVINESQIWKGFWPINMEQVQPEFMTWEKQVTTFEWADFIIGPHGSGMTNMVFSSGSPVVIELFPSSYINPCNFVLAQSIGAVYYPMVCDTIGKEDMEADLKELFRLIADIVQLSKTMYNKYEMRCI